MSLDIWGELNNDRPDHPESNIPSGKGQTVVNHWGDQSTDHQALRIGFLNIQTLPNHVLHHKMGVLLNSCIIIKLIV